MMKKGGLNFLSRRNQSLFDTNVQMKDMENVEFVFDAVMIPDSGTARVRARPTVKHFSTFGDGAGFAVPTPTVPVLPQINHTARTDRLSNGDDLSVDDLEEGQILIPPPPSTAPPPPPPQFIPPSPGHVAPPSAFFGSHVDLSTLEPPSMSPPKPPSLGTQEDVDLAMMRPPPTPPPKPPSCQISTVSAEDIPECPKFTPPLPPTGKPQPPMATVQKMPPPKPTRFSSVPNFELPPSGSSTPPKTTILTEQSDQIQLMLQENNSRNPGGVHTPTYDKEMSASQNQVPPVKPVRRNSTAKILEGNLQDLKENVRVKLPNKPASPSRIINSMAARVEAPQDVPNKILIPVKGSPTAERSAAVLSAQDIIHRSPVDPARNFSPLLNRKLQNLKTNELSNGKEVTTSPLALLMAAKEREKQRSFSRENSTKSNSSIESTSGSIHLSETRPNSFTVTPRLPVYPGSACPFIESKLNTENTKGTNSRAEPSVNSNRNLNTLSPTSGFDSISFLPPPPEFANDPEDETPPTMPPPDPPTKRTDMIPPLNSASLFTGPNFSPGNISSTTAHAAPITQFKPKPQAPPPSQPKILSQAPPPSQPKIQPQVPSPSPLKTLAQAPPPLQTPAQAPPPPKAPQSAAGQATLLSILQKKMLEMDPKLAPAPDANSGIDDWNYEDVGGTSSLNSTPKPHSSTLHAQSANLDKKELENKVMKKSQVKVPASSVSAKQQFGMTFLVRPGTKQPITPVSKTE